MAVLKAQVTLDKIIIISLVLVAVIILIVILTSKYIILSKSVLSPNYISSIVMNNIYNNISNIYIETKFPLNVSNGGKIVVSMNATFANKTSIHFREPYYVISHSVLTSGTYIYNLQTTSFSLPVNINNATSIEITPLLFQTSQETIIPSQFNNFLIVYYSKQSLEAKVPYYLSTSVSPPDSGLVSPSSSYYYNDTKVLITAQNTSTYRFRYWYGSGNGSYSGDNQTTFITINSSINETAFFGKVFTVNFDTNFGSVPFTINLIQHYTNYSDTVVGGNQYTYSFPTQYNAPNNEIYKLNYVSGCGLNGNNQTFTASAGYSGCTILANYSVEGEVIITQRAYQNDGASGVTHPNSGYYLIGSNITINALPNSGSGFFEWNGTGIGNYTGESNSSTFVLRGSINETAIFGTAVNVELLSTYQKVNITIDGVKYQTNITQPFDVGRVYTISYPINTTINPVTRIELVNTTGTTCQLNNNGTITILNSCTVYLNYRKQYLFTIEEKLGSGSASNTTLYGPLMAYSQNNTKKYGNKNWFNNGSVVTFQAGNNAGYGFEGFTSNTSSGFFGNDSYSKSIWANSGSCSSSYSNPSYSSSVSAGYIGWAPETNINGQMCASLSAGGAIMQRVAISEIFSNVTLNSPIIEIAKYNSSNNYIASGKHLISVNYDYYNCTGSSSPANGGQNDYETCNQLASGSASFNITLPQNMANYSSGFGNLIIYYYSDNNAYYDSGSGYWGSTSSYSAANTTLKNTMPFSINNNYTKIENQIWDNLTAGHSGGNLWVYNYNLFGVNVQSGVSIPTGTYQVASISQATSGSFWISTSQNYYGNYGYGLTGNNCGFDIC